MLAFAQGNNPPARRWSALCKIRLAERAVKPKQPGAGECTRWKQKNCGGNAMIEVRHINNEEIEAQIGGSPLRNMDSLYIDDVLASVDIGLNRLPTYLD